MNRKLWLILLVLVVLVAGCEQAVEPTTQPATSTGEVFMIALPRLVLDVDAEGNPSVLGISPAILKSLGLDLGGLTFPPDTVKQMTDGNIQHIELSFVGDGAGVLVNGQPVPQLQWNDASLQKLIDLAATLGLEQADLYRKIVPIANRLGLDVAIRFPRQPGADEIPLSAAGRAAKAVPAPRSEPASTVIKLEPRYDENGNLSIMGLSQADLEAYGIAMPGTLSPETIQKFMEGNVQTLEFRTKPDGMSLYVNGESLPSLVWDNNMLAYVAELYGQMKPDDPLLEAINAVLPNLDRLDIAIMMHFPVAPGQEPIAVQFH